MAFALMAAAVIVVGGISSIAPASPSRGLPQADLDVPRGLAPELRGLGGDKLVRVRILLRSQPVLEEAQSSGFQRQIAMRSAARVRRLARRTPRQISAAEQQLARAAEERYEAAISGLDDEATAAADDHDPLEAAIRRSGGRVVTAEPVPSTLVAQVPGDELHALADRQDVQAISPAPKPAPQLNVATAVTGAQDWWLAGHVGGEGTNDTVPGDVGTAGEGPDPTHPAFGSLTIHNSPFVFPDDDHATHVAGVVASGDGSFPGGAPGIDKLLGAISDAYLLGVPSSEGAGAPDPAETINESFGGIPFSDDEDDGDDLLVELFGVGYVSAGGNDGPTSGTASGIGRNVLSVGAFNDLDTLSTADDVIATFSSRGPTPGGRKKPDLIAPGLGIVAPDAQWEGANPDFTSVQGTSFSAPFVAAGMALMEGAGITDPKVQRAILVNSARPWGGTQTSWQTDVGWGALDLTTAFAQRANFQTGSVEAEGARFYRADQATGAKATLVWNRRGVWGNFPNCCLTAYTVTNLDLRQYVESTLAEVPPPSDPGHGGGPDAVDPNDTTEQVKAPAGGPQNIIYKVDAASTVEGAASEPFAIAAAAPLTALANPEVDPVNFSAVPSGTVNCQTNVTISTELENASPDLDAQSAQVTLNLPAGVTLVGGSATQTVSGGVLERSTPASESHTWTVRATSSGLKQLTITGSGGTMGETFTSSDQLSFTADCSPPTVTPTGTTVSPPGPVACGTDQVIQTTLRNSSITDAQSAQVSLALPPGAELVAGAPVQEVSGGVLELGTTSEPHSWTARAAQPGLSATVTGSGSDGAQVFTYPESVSIACQAGGGGGDSAAVTLEIHKLRIKRGRLVVGGGATSPSGPPPGEVVVEVERKNTIKSKPGPLRNGVFGARLKICEPGRWSASARYAGSPGFAAAISAPLTRRVREYQLRC